MMTQQPREFLGVGLIAAAAGRTGDRQAGAIAGVPRRSDRAQHCVEQLAGRSDEQRCFALILVFWPGGQDQSRRARRPGLGNVWWWAMVRTIVLNSGSD